MILWDVFEIFINFFQGYLLIYFIRHRLHISKPRILYAALAVFTIGIYLTVIGYLNITIPDLVVFVIPLAYSFFVSDEKWYVILLWNLFLTAMFLMLIELMFNMHMALLSVSWDDIVAKTPVRLMCIITTHIILTIAVFVSSGKLKKHNNVSALPIILFIASCFINLLLEETMFVIRVHTTENSVFLTYACMGLLINTVLQLIVFEYLTTLQEKKQAYEVQLKNIEMTNRYISEVKSMYTAFLARQHDIKKQVEVLYQWREQHPDDTDISLPEITQLSPVMMTGSTAVDALLTIKKATMDQAGIPFRYNPYPLDELPIPEDEFCTILANLLDNAIEAVQRAKHDCADHAPVCLSLARSWNTFFITCTNPMDPQTIRQNGDRFLSSKEADHLHGYGIQNIRNIVSMHNGISRFSTVDRTFSAEIVLPYGEKK